MPFKARLHGTLLEALEAMFQGRSRKDLRRLLHEESVLLNGALATDPKAPVKPGDEVDCVRSRKPVDVHSRVRILHEDDHIFVVDKREGILASGGIHGKAVTVEGVLQEHLARRGLRRAVRVCHRLDRDVSGLLLAAKNPGIAETVRSDPKRYLPERVYRAVVEGVPARPRGTLRSRLKDDVDQVVRAVDDAEGKLAVTHYAVLESSGRHALLEARLETGRKNQIRVQLGEIGHPIAGDAKYGAKTDPAGRICLHAARLVVIHPVTGERLAFDSPPPAAFQLALQRSRGERGEKGERGR